MTDDQYRDHADRSHDLLCRVDPVMREIEPCVIGNEPLHHPTEFLMRMRCIISQQLKECEDRLAIQLEFDNHGTELYDRAQLTANEYAFDAERSMYSRKAIALRLSLWLIAQGDYGKCVECGQLIDSKRLEIMPQADCCIQCQKRKELLSSNPTAA